MSDPFGFSEADALRIGTAVRAVEGGILGSVSASGHIIPDRNYTRIPFRNESGETVPAYAVMRVTGMTTVGGQPVFRIDKPNTSFGRLYLVNGAQSVAHNSGGTPGRGIGTWLYHADYVLYDTANTPAYGESWGPQDGTWTLKKNRYGFTIKGGNTGTGATSRAVAVQHFVNELRGKTSGAISSGASGTVNVYDGGGSIITSTTISATNLGSSELADDTAVVCVWCGGTWCIPGGGEASTIHRGTADAEIAKGGSGTVSRYTDGTNSDSGLNDTVYSDRETIRASTVVVYEQVGSNFYATECEPRFDMYRGTADAAIAKGATGTVSRYTDGTNTDSGTNDSVINDYEYIPSGAKVTYLRLGSNYYAVGVDTAIAIHRGVTSSTSTKGGTCTVDRYIPGTTTDSTINDTVNTPDAAIANGKNITYVEQAGTMYALQWGKQTLKMVVGTNSPRIKSGNAQIEASCIADVEVDSKETAAFEDKIALTECA